MLALRTRATTPYCGSVVGKAGVDHLGVDSMASRAIHRSATLSRRVRDGPYATEEYVIHGSGIEMTRPARSASGPFT